ncbi:helix-turn-helix domain-containing protein [Paenibacillaceae bacterium WGS1546]|uniref:helix-turn-helix domain-containing protein n=1 Tax=Cohnella sp. WGS1546 TaxID=3366810 RepID=UPI00372CFB22
MTIRSLDELAPTVNFASRATTSADTKWGRRVIPDSQLFYVVSGYAELSIGGKTYGIRGGECALYGPECPHELFAAERTDYYSIHFHWRHESTAPVHPGLSIRAAGREEPDLRPVRPAPDIPPYGPSPLPTLLTVFGLEPIMTKIVKEYELEQPGYGAALRGLMTQALTHVFRQLLNVRAASSDAGNKIEPAIAAMQEEPGRNWTVAELAAMCGYHPIHFSKLFKEEIGLLPKQYVIGERIKQAKRALLHGEKIDSLAERLGFTSIHYFSHQFKKLTGLTPTEFRMQGKDA